MTEVTTPWLKTIDPKVSRDISLPEHSVLDYLLNAANQAPLQKAIYFYGTEINYAELQSSVFKLANSLAGLGITKGDRVAICLDNCPQYIIAFFAVIAVGAVVVQISPMSSPRELEFLLADSGAQTLITLDYLYGKAAPALSSNLLSRIIVTSLYDYLPLNPYPAKPFAIPDQPIPITSDDIPIFDFRSLLNNNIDFVPANIDPRNDLAVLQYTSGTTGIPKGVMISHFNLTSYITLVNNMDYLSVFGQEVYPVILPMSHNYGMFQTVILPISQASLIVIMVRFHPDETLITIDHMQPTVFRAVPTILIMLSHHPKIRDVDLHSIRHWIVGGAPVPSETINFFRQVSGANIVEGYGLSESTSGVVINALYGQTPSGMGMPLVGMDARVIDPPTGKDVGFNQEGELLLKGPTICGGYWQKPEETAKTIKDGWLHTGDIVRMDEAGVLHFVDRLKELIIVSGFNVYPTEVESVLYEHPSVLETAVIGIPDERQGEAVKAFINLKTGQQASEKEIIEYCAARLSAYKVPKAVEFVDQFPRNATGKILKKELRRL